MDWQVLLYDIMLQDMMFMDTLYAIILCVCIH
jgi:hypothetical protein